MTPAPTAYAQCLNEMYGMRRFGIKLGLETIQSVLAKLGNPHTSYRIVHIAGTNGKGSVAASLATILTQAGHKVGLYTSPHLVRFNERIAIDGAPISDTEVLETFSAVRDAYVGERDLTFFEFTTGMAFLSFARHQVEWAIVETGMGGRLDATNSVTPDLTVITNVSIEHRSYLGNTLAAIAGEKAGIIKPGIPVVSAVRQPVAREVVCRTAEAQQAPLFLKGRDFRVRRRHKSAGQFNYYGIHECWRDLKINLAGDHQFENAALILAACELLRDQGVELPEAALRQGLGDTHWPGRLEIASDDPLVVLDGAHNLAAARNLGRHLRSRLQDKSITLVVGILDDKPYRAMLKEWVPSCQRVILTQPVIDRSLAPEALVPVVASMGITPQIVREVDEAVHTAIGLCGPDDAVCIAGSLYVVGEAKAALDPSLTPSLIL
ncbi:MAG: folylpolyglutamate synthase/dihydrofolate synthase family protein [Desulfosarcinaceae bacterium]|nr:folylpolyglutamate synthase/dihydrofolate synthase family protein [Desulfosarcinaceae bacterium]